MRPDEPCVHERDETGPLARFFYNTGLPCAQCEREAHEAWIDGVRAKLTAGLEAAARGETYDWNPTEPPPDTGYPQPEPAGDAYVLEPRADSPWEPWTLEQITALLTEHERSKRILACASDVYGRVRDAVEHSPLAAAFRVIEQPLLPDGQVLSIDPAALQPPPFELPADWLAPRYRCLSCLDPIHEPGYCLRCEPFAKALRARTTLTPIIRGLGGLT